MRLVSTILILALLGLTCSTSEGAKAGLRRRTLVEDEEDANVNPVPADQHRRRLPTYTCAQKPNQPKCKDNDDKAASAASATAASQDSASSNSGDDNTKTKKKNKAKDSAASQDDNDKTKKKRKSDKDQAAPSRLQRLKTKYNVNKQKNERKKRKKAAEKEMRKIQQKIKKYKKQQGDLIMEMGDAYLYADENDPQNPFNVIDNKIDAKEKELMRLRRKYLNDFPEEQRVDPDDLSLYRDIANDWKNVKGGPSQAELARRKRVNDDEQMARNEPIRHRIENPDRYVTYGDPDAWDKDQERQADAIRKQKIDNLKKRQQLRAQKTAQEQKAAQQKAAQEKTAQDKAAKEQNEKVEKANQKANIQTKVSQQARPQIEEQVQAKVNEKLNDSVGKFLQG